MLYLDKILKTKDAANIINTTNNKLCDNVL